MLAAEGVCLPQHLAWHVPDAGPVGEDEDCAESRVADGPAAVAADTSVQLVGSEISI